MKSAPRSAAPVRFGVVVLAGGLSQRMGRDKTRLRLGSRTLLGHVRAIALEIGGAISKSRSSRGHETLTKREGQSLLTSPATKFKKPSRFAVRVIRHDVIKRCGPLGGLVTALRSSRADAEIFLACDMPFVSAVWAGRLMRRFVQHRRVVFTNCEGVAGFPLLLSRADLPIVEAQIAQREFSLQQLARALRADRVRVPRRLAPTLFNINTAEDWQRARRKLKIQSSKLKKMAIHKTALRAAR